MAVVFHLPGSYKPTLSITLWVIKWHHIAVRFAGLLATWLAQHPACSGVFDRLSRWNLDQG